MRQHVHKIAGRIAEEKARDAPVLRHRSVFDRRARVFGAGERFVEIVDFDGRLLSAC